MKRIRPKLLAEFRGPGICDWCKHWVWQREAAHVLSKGMGNGRQIDHRWNLVALCAVFTCGCKCHYLHHQGQRPIACDLWAMIDQRDGLPPGTAEKEIRRIRRL